MLLPPFFCHIATLHLSFLRNLLYSWPSWIRPFYFFFFQVLSSRLIGITAVASLHRRTHALGCTSAPVWPVYCSNTSARQSRFYVVFRNLMTASMSSGVLLTRGGRQRWWDIHGWAVGSGNPPHITSFSSHSFSHLHPPPSIIYSVCLCLRYWAPVCVCVCDCVLQRRCQKKKKKTQHNLQVCFPVLLVSAYMPLHTPQLCIVGFVVHADM